MNRPRPWLGLIVSSPRDSKKTGTPTGFDYEQPARQGVPEEVSELR